MVPAEGIEPPTFGLQIIKLRFPEHPANSQAIHIVLKLLMIIAILVPGCYVSLTRAWPAGGQQELEGDTHIWD